MEDYENKATEDFAVEKNDVEEPVVEAACDDEENIIEEACADEKESEVIENENLDNPPISAVESQDDNHNNQPEQQNNNEQDLSKKKKRKVNWVLLSEDDTKRLYKKLSILSLTIGLALLALFFAPAILIDNISLGNFYESIGYCFKYLINMYEGLNFLNIEVDIPSFYLMKLVEMSVVAAISLICGVLIVLSGIKHLVKQFAGKKMSCMDVRINIGYTIIKAILGIAALVAIFFHISYVEEVFLVNMVFQKIVVVLIMIYLVLNGVIKYTTAKKCERLPDNRAKLYTSIDQTHDKIILRVSKYQMLFVLSFLPFIALSFLTRNNYLGKIIDPVEQNRFACIAVGEELPDEEIKISKYDTDLGVFVFSKHHDWKISYGENHLFYKFLLGEIDNRLIANEEEVLRITLEEGLKSTPKDEIEKLTYKYRKQIEKLNIAKNIVIERLNSVVREETSYKFDESKQVVVEYIYNTNVLDKTQYQYGEAPITILTMCKEEIRLNKNVFDVETDFSSTEIIATVIYADGSFKISLITPDNFEELNNAPRGTHTIKWSDSWGEYSTQITIK